MTAHWFHARETWALIAGRYVPRLAGLNLAWEALQIPLYTIWTEASTKSIAFAIFHCTLGDVRRTSVSATSLVLKLTHGNHQEARSAALRLIAQAAINRLPEKASNSRRRFTETHCF